MDTRYLETLLEVVEGGSLAAAGRRQNITAAAVGQRLKALEQELGTRLVARSGATVRPTSACLRMLPRLQSILSETRRLQSDVAEDGLAGPYRLGVISTGLSDYVPSLVTHLPELAPDVELVITPGSSTQLYDMVSRADLDAAILVEPHFQIPKTLAIQHLNTQPFAWVTPTEPATADLPLVVYDRTSWGGEIAWRWIEQQATVPQVLCEMDSPETVASLVASGVARAVLPIWASLAGMSGINIHSIEELTPRSIVFVHRGTPIDRVCVGVMRGG
ncbi:MULTISPECIES: LysR family transcriptional regulator [Roseobacteraceae]|uniref:LysR family transcriptional regulator n=1 Tax=Falsiruegeria litorea TaxID=1280831 RepID=A0ABS5WXG3_9RHOB|nr:MULTISPECIES: LysR family transcriptional regulator [Roseobacteraceae]MBT3143814.1 LysR family transcriptional regulator [Falsiruegeria litorea]MBT8169521.1 LysR family transcriptional regulator [Falsiruegeria litorea]